MRLEYLVLIMICNDKEVCLDAPPVHQLVDEEQHQVAVASARGHSYWRVILIN